MTVAVTVRLPAVVDLPHRVAAVGTILPDETIATNGTMTVTTATWTAEIAITTVVTGTVTAGTAIVTAPVTAPVAPKTAIVTLRMIGTAAKMSGTAATTSVKMGLMAKTGKVRRISLWLSFKLTDHVDPQYPWTPCLRLMMSWILQSRSTLRRVLSSHVPPHSDIFAWLICNLRVMSNASNR